MKYVIALNDLKANAFGQPMFVPSVNAGLRAISDEVNRGGEGNVLAAHAEDFEIWLIARFDAEKGEFMFTEKKLMADEEEPVRRLLARASDLRR